MVKFITKNKKVIPISTRFNTPNNFSSNDVKIKPHNITLPPITKDARELLKEKITLKDFAKSGNFLEDEVRRRAEKGSPHFFDKDTMRFFSSRVSELMWKDHNQNIWFITSEADRGSVQHSGSTRAFTVRKSDKDGDITTVSKFQEFSTLNEARTRIKNIIGLGVI